MKILNNIFTVTLSSFKSVMEMLNIVRNSLIQKFSNIYKIKRLSHNKLHIFTE